MINNQSIVKKIEIAIDDFLDLWKRSKLLFLFVIIFILALGAYFVIPKFIYMPKLKSELEKKENTIKELEVKISKVEHERDKAQTQLAPFLAVANKKFSESPQDKRLDLLLNRLEQTVDTFQDIAKSIPVDRKLNQTIKNKIIERLKLIEPLVIEISCIVGDQEAISLAAEFKEIFENADWKVHGITMVIINRPVKTISLIFGKKPSRDILIALAPIFNSLGYPREYVIDEKINNNLLKILVGSNK